jgi:hypothetical protein
VQGKLVKEQQLAVLSAGDLLTITANCNKIKRDDFRLAHSIRVTFIMKINKCFDPRNVGRNSAFTISSSQYEGINGIEKVRIMHYKILFR